MNEATEKIQQESERINECKTSRDIESAVQDKIFRNSEKSEVPSWEDLFFREKPMEENPDLGDVRKDNFVGDKMSIADDLSDITISEEDITFSEGESEVDNGETEEKPDSNYKNKVNESRELKEQDGIEREVHHMPADSTNDILSRGDGPAIIMEKDDHRQTASCGNSKEAREYQDKQKELIEDGKFREAVEMDIDDIREKFGDKYDSEIADMEKYVDKLEKEGKV